MKLASLIAVSATAATLVLAPCVAGAAELLTNGGFEDIGVGAIPEGWGGLTYYTDGTHVAPTGILLPGWTVESGSVDLAWSTSGWGPAHSGTFSMDINGWTAGTIAQSFGTVAGQIYNVSYFYSRNPANAPSPAEALVSAGGVTQAVTAVNDGSFGGMSSMLWKEGGFTFVGDGNQATIRLAAVTEGNAGVFFDDLSVTTGGVPEPSAWVLMIGGFGAAGAALRRRRGLATA